LSNGASWTRCSCTPTHCCLAKFVNGLVNC
jgi:hypothetical protein